MLSRRQIKPVELTEIVLEKLARFLVVLEALSDSEVLQMLCTVVVFTI